MTQWCLFHTNDNGHKVGMPKMQETKVCHLKTSGETNTTCQTPVCQEKKAWSDCEPMFQCAFFQTCPCVFIIWFLSAMLKMATANRATSVSECKICWVHVLLYDPSTLYMFFLYDVPISEYDFFT